MLARNFTRNTYFLIILYAFWGWVFSYTIWSSTLANYILLIALIIFSFGKLIKNNLFFSKQTIIWLPFCIYYIIHALRVSNFVAVEYWLLFFMIISFSYKDKLHEIPLNFIYYNGIFMIIGILIQIFFNGFYTANILHVFKNQVVEFWNSGEYGYNGFTFQLGYTSASLLFAEYVLLYIRKRNQYASKQVFIRYFLICLIIVCVFLTGKRLNSVMAFLVPILIYGLSKKISVKKLFNFSLILILIAVSIFFIYYNAEQLQDSLILRRFAGSLLDEQAGESIVSGRDKLWENAIILFKESPLFGSGLVYTERFNENAHNMYLQCLCEAGILGLTLFIIPLIYCLSKTVKLCRSLVKTSYSNYIFFSLACQLHFMLNGCTENSTIFPIDLFMYAIGLAIYFNISLKVKRKGLINNNVILS